MKNKKQLLSLFLWFLTLSIGFNHGSIKAMTQENKTTLQNEKWIHNSLMTELGARESLPNKGINCYFYENGDFEIEFWESGISSGFHFTNVHTGKYLFDSSSLEVILIHFDKTEFRKISDEYDSPPIPFYIMNGFKQGGGLPHINLDEKEFPTFSKCYLKIVEDKGNNKFVVEGYAYKENGEKVEFGENVFFLNYSY